MGPQEVGSAVRNVVRSEGKDPGPQGCGRDVAATGEVRGGRARNSAGQPGGAKETLPSAPGARRARR